MSVVIFFGLTGSIVLVGLTLLFLTLRHHWKQSKLAKEIDMP
jgi:hypothetical protein